MKFAAEGYNSFETKKAPSGVIKYLPDPKSVIALIQSGKLKEHILLVQGGTTTFPGAGFEHGSDWRDYDVRCAGVASRNSLARISDAVRHDRISDGQRCALRDRRQQ